MWPFKKQKKEEKNTKIPSLEECNAFFEADKMARENAGLTNLPGEYTFTCPNCNSLCKGSWHSLYGEKNLHGRTGCQTCNIYLIV